VSYPFKKIFDEAMRALDKMDYAGYNHRQYNNDVAHVLRQWSHAEIFSGGSF
jgi:hypothetical protein